MNYIKKHKKAALLIGIMTVILVVFFSWQRKITLSNTLSGKLEDNPRKQMTVESEFYSKQLTQKEHEVYLFLKENIENLKGGVLTLPESINGKEYQRIVTALECEGENYFYGFVEIPMTEDEVYVQYEDKDLNRITENEISKVILFLSCAEGIEIQAAFAQDGTISNLNEIREGLAVNNETEVDEISRKLQNTEQILDEIIAGIPKNSGEKSTVDYFLDWMKENMKPIDDMETAGKKVSHIGELLDKYYISNHAAAVLDGKATALGYAKILAELCNRTGMEAHIVAGTWQGGWVQGESYVFCAVNMDGQTVYIDASGKKSVSLAGERYLTAEEAFNHLKTVDYFSYK